MRMSLQCSKAVFQTTWKGPIDLRIQWSDDSTFEVDWASVCSRWGRGVIRLHDLHGVRGLLEDGDKFRKYIPDGEEGREKREERQARTLAAVGPGGDRFARSGILGCEPRRSERVLHPASVPATAAAIRASNDGGRDPRCSRCCTGRCSASSFQTFIALT